MEALMFICQHHFYISACYYFESLAKQNLINTFNVVIQIFIFDKIFGIKQIGKTLVQ